MRRIYLALLLCLIFMSGICVLTTQAAILGFDTEELPSEEKTSLIEKIRMSLIQDDSIKTGIQCFDVSQNGNYALAVGKGSDCRIYVYDLNNTFLYGFKFCSDGDYGIEFHKDALAIYFVRGNTIAIYDSSGVCVDARKVTDTRQNLIYAKEMLNRNYKKVSEKEYFLERDADIGDAYSRFVVTNEYGIKTVLLDTSAEHTIAQSALLVVPICFFALVIWSAYKKRKG